MVELIGNFSRLSPKKIAVFGDFMLDTYTIGKARRISPEAPVAVLHVQREEHRPGGAGNVVLNLQAMGATVVPIGRIGHDPAGTWLQHTFSSKEVTAEGLMVQNDYPTPVKNRILADNQQIVRVDHESILPLDKALEARIIDKLPELLAGVDLIAISDYGKGFLSEHLLQAVIQHAKRLEIPVISDPKGIDFYKYRGSTIIKPNLGEAYAAANLMPDSTLDQVAERILKMTSIDALMITRSESGISIFEKSGVRHDFPVRIREVRDVTGAGDTVLAMLAFALANGLSIAAAAQLSNVAAGIAIEKFGCAQISLADLARRLLDDDVQNKVFDLLHLFALKEALRNHRFRILSFSTTEGLTLNIFNAIQTLGTDPNCDLIIHLSDQAPNPDFVKLLASFHNVNFIILDHASLSALTEGLSPEAIYTFTEDNVLEQASIDHILAVNA